MPLLIVSSRLCRDREQALIQLQKIEDNQALAKVCYYGTEAAGKESYFAKHHSDFSEGKRFILTHIAAAYAYGSADAFYGGK